jgi:hypothetical protein
MGMREKNINPLHLCPECKEYTKDGHFVPPSLGEEGFYVCATANPIEQAAGIEKRKNYPPVLPNVPNTIKKEEEVIGLPDDKGPVNMTNRFNP